jgi:hypothetical protein
VPRPYTPPVERLSISSHGLEYGFPSTHSTNAVSVSLYFAQLYLQSLRGDEPLVQNSIVLGLCALYGVSVVAGSELSILEWHNTSFAEYELNCPGIYCGMHSMTGEFCLIPKLSLHLKVRLRLHSWNSARNSDLVREYAIHTCLRKLPGEKRLYR